MYQTIDLSVFFNNKGVTSADDCDEGFLTFARYSLPRQIFDQRTYQNNRIPFKFTFDDKYDNMELEAQTISVPEQVYEALYIVGASNNGHFFDDVTFVKRGKTLFSERVFFTDITFEKPLGENEQIFLEFPYFNSSDGKKEEYQPKLWINSISFERPVSFDQLQFGDNPSIHIFALTLKREEGNHESVNQ